MVPAFLFLPHHIVYGTPLLIAAYDRLGLVVGLARMCVCTSMCVYTHTLTPRLSLYFIPA